jgi:hypothetical protein
MRHLNQDTRAVARVFFNTGTTMIEILQNLKGIGDDGVRFLPLHVTDKADAAGVMLELRIIQALFRGESVVSHFWYERGRHLGAASGQINQHSACQSGFYFQECPPLARPLASSGPGR